MKIQTDYSNVDSILIAYPEGFKNEFEGLVPFYDKLITKIPHDIKLNIVVNNLSAGERLKAKFKKKKINVLIEDGWDDIWVRDVMGIAVDSNIVKPVYDSTYCDLLKKRRNYPKLNAVAESIIKNKFNKGLVKIPLNLDGGNIILNNEYAFITQKVFSDNPDLTEKEILDLIVYSFGVAPVIVPLNSEDYLGHIDGYMAFIDEQTIAVVEYPKMEIFKKDNEYLQTLEKYCHDLNLRIVTIQERPLNQSIPCECELKCKRKVCSFPANGNYINFLRLNDTIILPEYTLPTLKETIYYNNVNEEILSNMGFQVIKINCDLLGQHGGSLRCLSFTYNSN